MGTLETMDQEEQAWYNVGLEFKQRLDKLERDFEHFKPITGPKGERGDKGSPGSIGKAGDLGTAGENGINGINGKNGIDGKNGSAGINGKNGINGINGKDGKTPIVIYEDIQKKLDKIMGSLGSASANSEAEKKALEVIEELHYLYKKQKRPVWKKLLGRD